MQLFLTNLILALIWTFLVGRFTLGIFLSGVVLGYGLLWLSYGHKEHAKHFKRLPKAFLFLLFYLYEIVKANLIIAWDVVTPKDYMKPGVIAVPMEAKTDLEITLLANLITMTPGTLAIDISTDRKYLYVHALYAGDPDELRREIKESLEKKVLDILR